MSTNHDAPVSGLHADRAAGRHRDHRRADRPAAAGRAGGARGRAAGPVRQQPGAARHRDPELRVVPRGPPARRGQPDRADRERRPRAITQLDGPDPAVHRAEERLQEDGLQRRTSTTPRTRRCAAHVIANLPLPVRRRPRRPERRRRGQQLRRLPQRRRGADRRQQQGRLLPQQPRPLRGHHRRHLVHDLRRREAPRRRATSAGSRARRARSATPGRRQLDPAARGPGTAPAPTSEDDDTGGKPPADGQPDPATSARRRFRQPAPGRGELRVRRRLGPVPQDSISRDRLPAPGNRADGEMVSDEQY